MVLYFRFAVVMALFFSLFSPVSATNLSPHSPTAHGGYDRDSGPTYWASLDPAYALCGNGQSQSPINIRKTVNADIGPIQRRHEKHCG